MKLLNLTNVYYITFSLVFVFLANTYIMYRAVNFADAETREHMVFEMDQITNQLKGGNLVFENETEIGDRIWISPLNQPLQTIPVFKDTVFYDPKEFEKVPFTKLTFSVAAGSKFYLVTITKRLMEDEDVLNGIFTSFAWVAFCIVISYFLFNKWFSRTKLKPFYHAISQLKKFDVRSKEKVEFLNSNIEEFKTLNSELKKLTFKAHTDYQNLKEFTENVSHETRTPIAIVQSKMEMLLQSPNLTEHELEIISLTLDSIQRLNDKNEALILLSCIDNYQFKSEQSVDVSHILVSLLGDMTEFVNRKQLNVTQRINEVILKKVNGALIEVLFRNLIENAIKYNVNNGQLRVLCTDSYITIANTGEKGIELNEEMFERYNKGKHPDGLGLGLAIVQKICKLYQFELSYTFGNDLHYFSVSFNKSDIEAVPF